MKKRWISWIMVVVLIVSCIAGCSLNGGKKALINPNREESESAQKVARGLNEFSLTMGSSLYQDYEGQNFVCSPISLWLPLAALLNASDEVTQEKLLKSLGADGVTVEEVNKAASRILYSLYGGNEKKSVLQIANMICVDENYTMKTEFAKTYMDYYRGTGRTMDFAGGSAAAEINQWISEQTHGRIEEIDLKLKEDTVAVILNTVYFNDRWLSRFNKEHTHEDVFYAENGESTTMYMEQYGRQMYYEDDRLQAVWLLYEKGATLLILLPKEETAGELYQSLTVEDLEQIDEGTNVELVSLTLPKFKLEAEIDLEQLLRDLQVPYEKNSQNGFDGLVEEDIVAMDGGLQKVLFQIDEDETVATVVTATRASATLGSGPKIYDVTCNKPFVFFLTNTTEDGGSQILFGGVVNQP